MDPLHTDADLAETFGVPEKTIANWRRRYDWPHVLVGRSIRYTAEQVDEIVRQHTQTPVGTSSTVTALPGQTARSAAYNNRGRA